MAKHHFGTLTINSESASDAPANNFYLELDNCCDEEAIIKIYLHNNAKAKDGVSKARSTVLLFKSFIHFLKRWFLFIRQ